MEIPLFMRKAMHLDTELYDAKIYYCTYLTIGEPIKLTPQEMAHTIVGDTSEYGRIVWIYRKNISPHEGLHGFGVDIGKEAIQQFLSRYQTYEYVVRKLSAYPGIKCLSCGLTSWNSSDVQYKFCGNCNEFHDFRKIQKQYPELFREYNKLFSNAL